MDSVEKKLYRSLTDRRFLGVCGGIAEYLGVDSTLIRLLWLLAISLGAGTGLLVYLAAAIIIPERRWGK